MLSRCCEQSPLVRTVRVCVFMGSMLRKKLPPQITGGNNLPASQDKRQSPTLSTFFRFLSFHDFQRLQSAARADAQPQNGELAVSKAQDIYSLTMKCRDLFSTYLDMTTSYTWQVLNYECRFLTWASTLAVIDDESTCLDRRLRLSPDIKQLVMSMLSVLERALERGEYHCICRIDHCFLTGSS